ncbi:MAG TPA: class I SAM-dependent methyltransferase [Gaiellaceae bacterium]|nr:class I SAM-dependent methyltransferase [Gaiellaceae bacterium]
MSRKEAPPDAFGKSAREYELGRTEWPQELVERVADDLELGPDAAVLDLGAGTGKLTRDLVTRFEKVIAVEPDGAMREVLEEVVPNAEALAGSGEAIPLPDDSVDAVFTAEAFHWYASDESVAEIVRVLRPHGGLAILWNLDFGDPEPPMGDELERVLDAAFEQGGAPGIGRVLSGFWREPLEKAAFEPLQEAEVQRTVTRTRDLWLANILSVSSIASLPDADQETLAGRLLELVPDVEYRWSIRTIVYWTRLA